MAIRKNPKADLRRTYGIFVEAGMVASLLLLILAFRANIQREGDLEIQTMEQEVVQMEEILVTKQIVKPPPPPRPPVPVEVPNDEIIDDEDLDLDASLDIEEPLANLPPPPPPEEEEEEPEPEIFVVVEEMPELIGGLGEIQRKIRYPEIARKAGVEGRVILQFIVNENGDVTEPTVVRGIGAGCDEEALRVVREAKFKPGKQRGKAVKVKMSLP
ncbi:MAG: energy transducer TonB, partial [Rhodothermales bacterium]